MKEFKTLLLIVLVLFMIIGIPLIMASLSFDNFKKECKEKNGILIEGTRQTSCLTKKDLKKLLEETE